MGVELASAATPEAVKGAVMGEHEVLSWVIPFLVTSSVGWLGCVYALVRWTWALPYGSGWDRWFVRVYALVWPAFAVGAAWVVLT